MSEWDERVYEAVGYGISSPETPESENYFAGEAPKLVNWHFYLKTHSRRKGRCSASVTVSFLPIVEAYLVDGHVIFSDGVERKSQNFTVGEIQSDPEWTKVFSIPNIRLHCVADGEPFTICVRYRLRESFDCTSLVCTDCFRSFIRSIVSCTRPCPRSERTQSLPEPTSQSPSQPSQHSSPQPTSHSHSQPPSRPSLPLTVRSLLSDFKKLLFSSDLSDVTFRIGDESIPAHQLILRTRVPYFERLFVSGMKETISKVITVEDFDFADFKEFLKFVYSGELPEKLETSPKVYLLMADKYDVQDLKESCSLAFRKKLTFSNVIDTLILAHTYHCPLLKERCFRGLRKEWKAKMAKESFAPLKPHPELMLEFIQST